MQRDIRVVEGSIATREPALQIARVNAHSYPVAVAGRHDDNSGRGEQSYLEDACSYDLFDLQDSGLVAA